MNLDQIVSLLFFSLWQICKEIKKQHPKHETNDSNEVTNESISSNDSEQSRGSNFSGILSFLEDHEEVRIFPSKYNHISYQTGSSTRTNSSYAKKKSLLVKALINASKHRTNNNEEYFKSNYERSLFNKKFLGLIH